MAEASADRKVNDVRAQSSQERQHGYYAVDFETTTGTIDYPLDGCVRVYLWSAKELWYEDEAIGYDVDSFLEFCASGKVKECTFHNAKFDTSYIIYRILELGWERSPKKVKGKNTFDILMTEMGAFMSMTLRFGTGKSHKTRKGDCVVKIRDSLKQFPNMSLEKVAMMLGIEGKTHLDVLKRREPDYVPTEEDIERVKGDTRILKRACEWLTENGHTHLTLSGDVMADYKATIGHLQYNRWFPRLGKSLDKRIRVAYRGGFTYAEPVYACKRVRARGRKTIKVLDVNSMYPWALRHCRMPYGLPWVSKDKPLSEDVLYIVYFSCDFVLKDGKLPTVQLKHTTRFAETEYLTKSEGVVEMAMDNVSYELFLEHYHVRKLDVKEYLCFNGKFGMFDEYVDKWMAVKEQASREHKSDLKANAKFHLNSLYGRFGIAIERANKVPYFEDGMVKWFEEETEGDGDYLPVAIWTTAYGRDKCIRSAQLYKDRGEYLYSDTDSIHVLSEDVLVDVHDTALGYWKLESEWKFGTYLRSKTYIHSNTEDTVEEVKCAGMPDEAKKKVTWDNFKIGAEYEGKLQSKFVKGGIALVETTYKITVGKGVFND